MRPTGSASSVAAGSLAAPAALTGDAPLAGSAGNVLDPILCLRTVVELAPGATHAWRSASGSPGRARRRSRSPLAVPRSPTCQLSWRRLRRRQSLRRPLPMPLPPPVTGRRGGDAPGTAPAAEALVFDNGFGGFAAGGREYVIRVAPGARPPLPWTHVVANESFGFITSESGAARPGRATAARTG